MISLRRSFTLRLMAALAVALLAYGVFVALLGRQWAAEHERESQQRLSHGLARHIVEHWPAIAAPSREQADAAARDALLKMLMVVNPAVQVYVLDADGRVAAYVGEPGMVREPQVDLAAVRAFLADAPLPLLGTDPMGSNQRRIFSAAMFAPRAGDARPPGYLYVVLDGGARDTVAAPQAQRRLWQGAALAAATGLVVALALGGVAMLKLTQPLHSLARRMRAFSLARGEAAAPDVGARGPAPSDMHDEVQTMASAFSDMTARLERQTARERDQASAHRETMASVAHDLRTPLTALHGHLEALAGGAGDAPASRQQVLRTALAQSDKVRRLSQQLFELAALQASGQVLQRERFALQDLVADAVQKFDQPGVAASVTLAGSEPGRLELDGDLHLIERAITNLIDNALRHAPGTSPVLVSLRREGQQAQIVVQDSGPGLPQELATRLQQGQSLRDPPTRRAGGGIGGLGLAIAQRVAQLHGGSLRPLPAPQGGTCLCLALPLLN